LGGVPRRGEGGSSTTEARRRDLYDGLDELLGTERAETLMAYLPAHESTDLATKENIARLDARFDRLEAQLDAGLAAVNQLDRFFLTQAAGLIAMGGTLIAALLL